MIIVYNTKTVVTAIIKTQLNVACLIDDITENAKRVCELNIVFIIYHFIFN